MVGVAKGEDNMREVTPNLRNVLKLAIRGDVIFSEQDLDKIVEWVETERAIKEMEGRMKIQGRAKIL